jgi:hypothetical protein
MIGPDLQQLFATGADAQNKAEAFVRALQPKQSRFKKAEDCLNTTRASITSNKFLIAISVISFFSLATAAIGGLSYASQAQWLHIAHLNHLNTAAIYMLYVGGPLAFLSGTYCLVVLTKRYLDNKKAEQKDQADTQDLQDATSACIEEIRKKAEEQRKAKSKQDEVQQKENAFQSLPQHLKTQQVKDLTLFEYVTIPTNSSYTLVTWTENGYNVEANISQENLPARQAAYNNALHGYRLSLQNAESQEEAWPATQLKKANSFNELNEKYKTKKVKKLRPQEYEVIEVRKGLFGKIYSIVVATQTGYAIEENIEEDELEKRQEVYENALQESKNAQKNEPASVETFDQLPVKYRSENVQNLKIKEFEVIEVKRALRRPTYTIVVAKERGYLLEETILQNDLETRRQHYQTALDAHVREEEQRKLEEKHRKDALKAQAFSELPRYCQKDEVKNLMADEVAIIEVNSSWFKANTMTIVSATETGYKVEENISKKDFKGRSVPGVVKQIK